MTGLTALTAAQVGTSLLQYGASTSAAAENLKSQTFQSRFQGLMERYQLRQQAELEEEERARQLRSAIGSQRTATAASGVIGGRTARLLEAKSRARASRAREQAAVGQTMQQMASEHQERQRVSGFRQQAQQQTRQSGINLLSGLAQAGSTYYQGQQAKRAQG